MGSVIPSSHSPNSNNNHHSMSTNNLVIQADEYSFSPSHTQIIAGEEITITLDNIGELEHELKIKEVNSSHNHQKNNDEIHVHSMAGEQQEISFTPVSPGEYSYICTIPGHAEAGMIGIIEVSSS
ncbi:plastocyanin/azurin family copper-binding protein [Oceanobacillus sp. CF4.6]|uniref:plastocyanin/azurin family copper-binding protein n=1 Tax=Oceanobacillus sp. CF4.6 TaxID=3373080 RepID=UPI003EE64F27